MQHAIDKDEMRFWDQKLKSPSISSSDSSSSDNSESVANSCAKSGASFVFRCLPLKMVPNTDTKHHRIALYIIKSTHFLLLFALGVAWFVDAGAGVAVLRSLAFGLGVDCLGVAALLVFWAFTAETCGGRIGVETVEDVGE